MIQELKDEYNKALAGWLALENTELSVAALSLVRKLSKETEKSAKVGDWNAAVTFSHYTHEVAKLFGYQGWYGYFLAVRRLRDTIEMMIKRDDDRPRQ